MPLFTPSPSGNQCFEGWFRTISRYKPAGVTLLDHRTLAQGFAVVGFLEGLTVDTIANDQLRTGTDGVFRVAVVGTNHLVTTPIPDGHRTDIVADPATAAFEEFRRWNYGQRDRGPYTICGPTFTDPNGVPYVIISSWEQGPWPHLIPPEPITISGTLGGCSPPGISQVWPCVDGVYISTGMWDSAEANRFVREWNAGQLLAGAELTVTGYPTQVRGMVGIVPTSYTVHTQGTTPIDDPGKVDFPERPDPVDRDPPGFDPENPDDFDPLSPWGGVDPLGPPDTGDPTDPGGDDNVIPFPTDPGGGDPGETGDIGSPAARGTETLKTVALASFALFFLPGLLKGKGEDSSWDMGEGTARGVGLSQAPGGPWGIGG